MHFLLVGPGALGCLLSSVVTSGIEKTGDSLTLLDYNRDRAKYLNTNGIVYHLGDTSKTIAISATSSPHEVAPVDVVLLCVKSYDVIASLAFCQPLLSEKTLLVFLQNGISHLSLCDHAGLATAAFGTTTEGATLLQPGQVRHAGSGMTYLGFLEEAGAHHNELLNKTREVFAAGGLQVSVTDNVLARIWSKLFINVGINALTATMGCKNGALLTLPGVDSRMKNAIAEAIRIAQAEHIDIIGDPYDTARVVCDKTAENISSMLQDVRNRRRTEIDAINGAIAAKGRQCGIETPENNLLCRQVKEIEKSYAPTP